MNTSKPTDNDLPGDTSTPETHLLQTGLSAAGYVCMYVCVYIFIYTHTYVCVYIYIYIYIHTYTYTHIHNKVYPAGRRGVRALCRAILNVHVDIPEGGMIRLEPSSSSNVSIGAFRACPLIELRHTAPRRAIRGNSISVNSTLPPLNVTIA